MNPLCRRLLFLALSGALASTTHAQTRPYDPFSDKSVRSNRQLGAYWRKKVDSLYNTAEYQALRDSTRNRSLRMRLYSGGSLFSGVVHSDVSGTNRQLALSGFPGFNEYAPLLGFGWNARSGQVLVDFTIVTNFGSRSKKDDEKYTFGGGNLIRLDLGFDVLHSQKIALYPYAGLGWRMAWVRYNGVALSKPGQLLQQGVYTSTEVMARSSRVGYQLGLGLDLRIAQRNDGWNNTFLFLKGGVNGAIGGERYKIDGKEVSVDIRPYDWEVQAGFKFMRPR